jgi:hypothetical protein
MGIEKLELLNSERHRNVSMHVAATDRPHCVQVIIGEFGLAATSCPLFLVKDPETGRFNVVALFGFRPGELLVDGADKGKALFVPLELARQGFFIEGDTIAIDLENPRFGEGASAPLFDASGEPSDETRLIQRIIGTLVQGREATRTFIDDMVRLRLVEPVDISLRFDDGESLTLEGLYTISLDALQDLDDATALSLFRNGHLAAALCIQGSQRQVMALAKRRNDLIGKV